MVWLVVSIEVLRVMGCVGDQIPPASLRSRVGMTRGAGILGTIGGS
jgi:hypothetical protein